MIRTETVTMIDEILNAYGARFVIAAGGVFLALVVLIIVLWIIRNKAPSPFVRGGRSRQPRLQVLDAAAVDTRRRLVLVRRDNIEHLILIGGPTDIVIESGIGEPKTYLAGELAANTALEQHDPAETPLPRKEQAVLQTPPAALQTEQPAAKPVVAPRREMRKEAPAVDLIMPAETPAPVVSAPNINIDRSPRPEQPVSRVQPKAPTAPEIVPEPVRAPQPTPAAAPTPAAPVASAAKLAPTPVSPPTAAATPTIQPNVQPPAPARPAPPVTISEPAKAEAPEVLVAPAAVQRPPPVRVEEAALVLDAARERILPPKTEPFPAERFQAPVDLVDIPAAVEAPVRVDPDMDSIKSEFEKILDTEVLNQPAPARPRPTVEPPVTRSLPVMDVSPAVKPPAPANSASPSSGAPASEGNLQNEIARIFGEMGATRKD